MNQQPIWQELTFSANIDQLAGAGSYRLRCGFKHGR